MKRAHGTPVQAMGQCGSKHNKIAKRQYTVDNTLARDCLRLRRKAIKSPLARVRTATSHAGTNKRHPRTSSHEQERQTFPNCKLFMALTKTAINCGAQRRSKDTGSQSAPSEHTESSPASDSERDMLQDAVRRSVAPTARLCDPRHEWLQKGKSWRMWTASQLDMTRQQLVQLKTELLESSRSLSVDSMSDGQLEDGAAVDSFSSQLKSQPFVSDSSPQPSSLKHAPSRRRNKPKHATTIAATTSAIATLAMAHNAGMWTNKTLRENTAY